MPRFTLYLGSIFAVFAAGYLHLQAQDRPVASARTQAAAQSQPAAPVASAVEPRAVLDKYCVTCHNERLKTAGLVLENRNVVDVADGAEIWEKVLRKLQTQEMPPVGRPRPDHGTYVAMVSYFE